MEIRRPLLLTAFLIALLSTGNIGKAQEFDSISNAITEILRNNGNKAPTNTIKNIKYRQDTALVARYLNSALEYQTENYDSLYFYVQKATRLSLRMADLPLISRSVQLYGRYFIMREDFQNATSCFLQSLKIEEKLKNRSRIADLNDELGSIYYYQEIFNKALSYYTAALTEYETTHDTLNIAKCYNHIGTLYGSREYCETRNKAQKQEDFATAIQYQEKALRLCALISYKPLMINCYVNLASIYNKLDKPEKALPYLQNAIAYYRTTNNMNRLAGALHTTGIAYFKAKQYKQSIRCFEESLEISKEYHFTDGIQYLYESMAQTYMSAKDYKNAYDYYVKYMTIRDSLVTAEKSKELFGLETRYQTEKKENEIIRLTADKREKSMLLFVLLGLFVILSVLGYFVLKNIRNKKLIAEQTIEIKEKHIQELEKERQLLATKSVLKGEESERSRMARDLHDGLGGLLSGVKLNLSSMKGNSIITHENAQAFDHAIKLLDTSISELRRVAHNLMPETLNHYGLKTALTDFVSEMSLNLETQLTFGFFGKDIRFETQFELTAYRIAQELVNNALKHSGATRIDLQLIAETDRVCIQVVDNGKGFDTSGQTGHGKGLVSIRDRVAANKGTFEIESIMGQGTEASVEFLLT